MKTFDYCKSIKYKCSMKTKIKNINETVSVITLKLWFFFYIVSVINSIFKNSK